jgi:hypothetical protein
MTMMDRRTTLKWIAAVSAAALWPAALPADTAAPATKKPKASGYGTDPDLLRDYKPGELWPLTMTSEQRRTAVALCALIIPKDAHSPSAADLEVHLFIDEWISAPYPSHAQDRQLILEGFAWLEREARQRYSKSFAALDPAQQTAICDDICYVPKARPECKRAAKFFARYRDLTAGGFYTTPTGRADLKYVGNVALASFDGPPLEALRKVGLAESHE